jgi:tetratricopeptide (TPR) repeat protein
MKRLNVKKVWVSLAVVSIMCAVSAFSAYGQEKRPYSDKEFEELKNAGVLLWIISSNTSGMSEESKTINYKNAVKSFSDILNMTDLPAEKKAQALHLRGLVYYFLKDYDNAIKDFGEILTLDGISVKYTGYAYLHRGNTYMARKEVEKAKADYEAAAHLENAPEEVTVAGQECFDNPENAQKRWELFN